MPQLPPIPFTVRLKERQAWNPIIGARYEFDGGFEITGEYGGGDRHTVLVNATWRFGGAN